MLRQWRRAALVALAAGAAVAAQLVATGPAQAAAPAITIAATAKLPPVTGYVSVIYRAGPYANAKIHGTITGATAGEVAALYAQQFPYKRPAVRLSSITLKTARTAYSFTVTPTLATRYAVRLFASSKATTPIASSRAQDLYVTNQQLFTKGPQQCGRPVCHEVFPIDTFVPPSTLSAEIGKHVYPYFGLNLGPSTSKLPPPPPKWLYLNAGHASVTKARRISAGEFEYTLTYSFTIGNHSFYWLPNFCTRDTESKDGLGLPGYHSCGASRIPVSQVYLG
jgi:hypothetical protein